MLLFDGKSPMFVIGYYPTEIRLYGILLPTFYILMSIIDPKIGHTGCKRTTSSGIFDNQFRNFGTVR